MSEATNCYTLLDDGSIRNWISVRRGDENSWYVPIGTLRLPLIPHRLSTDIVPRHANGHLYEAVPCRADHKDALTARRNWRGALVMISTAALDFSDDLATKLPISNSWAGAESHMAPVVQYGRRSAREQYQLIVIPHDGYALAADRNARYIMISNRNGIVSTMPAQSIDLARVLASRAEYRLKEYTALVWTMHALRELEAEHLWSRKLEEKKRRYAPRSMSHA